MQFRINAIMIVTVNLHTIKENRMVNGIRALNAISTTYRQKLVIGAETSENTHHAPIGNTIAYANMEVGIVERRVFLHQTRIAQVDFDIAFVERL